MRTWLLGIFMLGLFASSLANPGFIDESTYTVYQGEWRHLPDPAHLLPLIDRRPGLPDLSNLDSKLDYVVRFHATLSLPIAGKYLVTLKAGDTCRIMLDGKPFLYSPTRRTPLIEELEFFTAGTHHLMIDYLVPHNRDRKFEFRVEGPDFYQVDRFHWLYFGWQNDYPKSWSFMSGTVMPGRKQRVQFAVKMDGLFYVPDEFDSSRRKQIDWHLAEGYLPSPVSKWMAGKVAIHIQHFADRIGNDRATAVYSRVQLTNRDERKKSIRVLINAGPDFFIPLEVAPNHADRGQMEYDLQILPGQSAKLDFVSLACGEMPAAEIKSAGSFDDHFAHMRTYYLNRMDALAGPVTLPNPGLVELYKSAQITMWGSIVTAANGDVEMRGSGGNPAGYYPYDRTFSHDVPNMVDQFIREGDFDLAKAIMQSSYYQRLGRELEQDYLDAIPKYIIPYATYLQRSGDRDYFSPAIWQKIEEAAHRIQQYRDIAAPGAYKGIMQKSHSLDNPPYYLLVDNFAALHGLAAYRFLSQKLGYGAESQWAEKQLVDLNASFNSALDSSMQRRQIDWYMSTLDDDTYFWQRGYDGNWIGTSMMMSTFPWNAHLIGLDLGGTWRNAFEQSIMQALRLRDSSPYNIPAGSWGAWWGHEYGTCYNAGMGLQLLYSEMHRTEVIRNLEFLLQNQSAPMQWGESFDRAGSEYDWTVPAADLETWALGFDKQALIESNVSVHSDGSVIIGRGIPDSWLKSGQVIAWKNILINDGNKMDFRITSADNSILLELDGDHPSGKILFNLPLFRENIVQVTADGVAGQPFDYQMGMIELRPTIKKVQVTVVHK
jgi:hypothetical protein